MNHFGPNPKKKKKITTKGNRLEDPDFGHAENIYEEITINKNVEYSVPRCIYHICTYMYLKANICSEKKI